MKFLLFIICFILALLLMIYRKQIVDFIGKSPWFEQKLGPGGTYTMIIIIAIVIWLGSLMYALGTFDAVLGFLAKFF